MIDIVPSTAYRRLGPASTASLISYGLRRDLLPRRLERQNPQPHPPVRGLDRRAVSGVGRERPYSAYAELSQDAVLLRPKHRPGATRGGRAWTSGDESGAMGCT